MPDPNQSGTVERSISAWLAMVLAAAASGSQSPYPIYVVARYDPDTASPTRPFNVQPPYRTRTEAEQARNKLGDDYGVFGPFVNDLPIARLDQDRVDSILITTTQGKPLPIAGNKYDALFYSYEAVQKFAVPLYVQEYGPAYPDELLKRFSDSPLALMAHLPWSEEVLVGDDAADPTPHGFPVFLKVDADGQVCADRFPPPPPSQG